MVLIKAIYAGDAHRGHAFFLNGTDDALPRFRRLRRISRSVQNRAHFVFTYNFIETRIVHNKITFLVKTSAYVKSQFRHLTYLFVKRHARESFLHFRLYGLVARNSRCGLRHDRSCSQRRQECNDAFHVFNI